MIPPDKIAHALLGAAVASTVTLYGIRFLDPVLAVGVGFACGVFVNAAKEVWDKLSSKGTPDLMDLVVGAIGAAVVLPRLI